jgi:hypothetical protein
VSPIVKATVSGYTYYPTTRSFYLSHAFLLPIELTEQKKDRLYRMISILKNITRAFKIGDRRRVYNQLQWQRFLLRTGVPATAQVLDMVEEKGPMFGYVQIRFWVMLQVKGNITYRHIQTLLNKENLPSVGDTIYIRFCPDDMSKVIVI